MVAQALIAFLILLTFNTTAIMFGILALLPVAIYPFMKRVTWWPQIFLGLAFNWGALMGWVAHSGEIGLAPVILYLAGIAWTLHYDTIYAHQDREDDALIGVKSTARLFEERTHQWLIGFSILAVLGAGIAAYISLTGMALVVAMIGVLIYAAHLAWQLMRLDINDTDNCMKLFRSNRDTGLILVFAFLAASVV